MKKSRPTVPRQNGLGLWPACRAQPQAPRTTPHGLPCCCSLAHAHLAATCGCREGGCCCRHCCCCLCCCTRCCCCCCCCYFHISWPLPPVSRPWLSFAPLHPCALASLLLRPLCTTAATLYALYHSFFFPLSVLLTPGNASTFWQAPLVSPRTLLDEMGAQGRRPCVSEDVESRM